MTAIEMSNTFDIKLNSYLLQHGYGNQQGDIDITINEYEKSLYLTNAQYDIVRSLYEGTQTNYNVAGESFENSEEIRRILAQLVKTSVLTSPISGTPDVDKQHIALSTGNMQAQFYSLPSNIWYILYEQVEMTVEGCDSRFADVIPAKYEELRDILANPFKRPNINRVIRLDIDNTYVELVSSIQTTIDTYLIRYLSKPSPIITANLPKNVSIEGERTTKSCELNTVIHDTIVDVAIQLAIQSKSIGQTEEKTQSKSN